ncbi:MAG: glycosyltransferase, partial [Planctomycetaceae bacterium]
KLLRELPHDVVLATAPPYSNLLLGRRLADAFHLPLVLDFRDEWDLSSEYLENSSRGERPHRVQSRMQSRLLRRADIVIATTEASARRLTERLRSAGGRGEVRCIHNGFDEDDFAALPWLQHAASLSKRGPGDGTTGRRSTVYWPPHPKPLPRGNGRAAASEAAAPPAESDRETFRIVYAGTLWNLTSVEPLARGVERLSESQRDLPGRLEVTFVGRKTPPQRALLERIAAAGCRVVSEDYCDHDRAVWLMSSADALCLLLSDLPGAERVVPAKLFEYLALGREILAILPDGEAAEIVGRFFPESRFRPDDPAGIADWLRTRITGERLEVAEIDSETLAPFTRQHQAGQLAEILESLIVSEDD